ncbi:unnamed protein product [Symbiodinium sp. KB8]|nr:unnamed protein product [Symbiodinium sp. KB8]
MGSPSPQSWGSTLLRGHLVLNLGARPYLWGHLVLNLGARPYLWVLNLGVHSTFFHCHCLRLTQWNPRRALALAQQRVALADRFHFLALDRLLEEAEKAVAEGEKIMVEEAKVVVEETKVVEKIMVEEAKVVEETKVGEKIMVEEAKVVEETKVGEKMVEEAKVVEETKVVEEAKVEMVAKVVEETEIGPLHPSRVAQKDAEILRLTEQLSTSEEQLRQQQLFSTSLTGDLATVNAQLEQEKEEKASLKRQLDDRDREFAALQHEARLNLQKANSSEAMVQSLLNSDPRKTIQRLHKEASEENFKLHEAAAASQAAEEDWGSGELP